MYSLLLTTHRRAAGRLHHFLARYHACQPEVGYPDGGALARVGVEDVLRLEIAVHYLHVCAVHTMAIVTKRAFLA
eukprot:scaffold105263_cov24-Phaeocystis_antarctica.AAC.1